MPPPPPTIGTPPSYGATPSYGGPVPAAAPGQKTNTLAITSLVLGIVGLVFCWCFGFLLSIGATVTGFMARSQIRERGEQGEGMAMAGLITGLVGIFLGLIGFVFFFIGSISGSGS